MGYYMKTQVNLKFGQSVGLIDVMNEMIPFMANYGWTMHLALQTLIGNMTEIIHIWIVDDLNDIEKGLHAALADPALGVHLKKLPDYMFSESIQIMTKLPYSN